MNGKPCRNETCTIFAYRGNSNERPPCLNAGMARLAILVLVAAAAGFTGQGLLSEMSSHAGHSAVGATSLGCNIKGNISLNTGERIYHVPGQEYYSAAVITTKESAGSVQKMRRAPPDGGRQCGSCLASA